jgi:hypothetical protein
MLTKTCSKKTCCECKQLLSLDLYCKDKSKKDGLHSRCKVCNRKAAKKQYHGDIEHWREYSKNRYHSNPEHFKQKSAKYDDTLKSGVYMIKNVINGKCYIGQSTKPYRRRCEHLSNLTKIYNGITNIQMYEDKKICGPSCFVFGMLEHCSKEELLAKEQYYINLYKPEYNEYKIR